MPPFCWPVYSVVSSIYCPCYEWVRAWVWEVKLVSTNWLLQFQRIGLYFLKTIALKNEINFSFHCLFLVSNRFGNSLATPWSRGWFAWFHLLLITIVARRLILTMWFVYLWPFMVLAPCTLWLVKIVKFKIFFAALRKKRT